MNYWIAEMTNMDVTSSLFDYFEVGFMDVFSHRSAHVLTSLPPEKLGATRRRNGSGPL